MGGGGVGWVVVPGEVLGVEVVVVGVVTAVVTAVVRVAGRHGSGVDRESGGASVSGRGARYRPWLWGENIDGWEW